MTMNDFHQLSMLGKLNWNWRVFGSVEGDAQVGPADLRPQKGKCPSPANLSQVKMMKLSDKEKENALNEVRILASIRHPNIAGYKEAFFEADTNQLCIVMEYCDGGDL